MEAYKFETVVLKNRIIKIPQLNKFTNREVEIFIVFKNPEKAKKEKLKADDFLNRWTGFIPASDSDEEKYNYLMEKYK